LSSERKKADKEKVKEQALKKLSAAEKKALGIK